MTGSRQVITRQDVVNALGFLPGGDAFEVAVAAGYNGTREQWLESLIGADGDDAYTIAVQEGFVGDRAAWLESLKVKGDPGGDAYDVAVDAGFVGDRAAWLASLGVKGDQGDDAYAVAQAAGFVGTRADWLESLKVKGDPGQDGADGDAINWRGDYLGPAVYVALDGVTGGDTLGYYIPAGYVGNVSGTAPPNAPWVKHPAAAAAAVAQAAAAAVPNFYATRTETKGRPLADPPIIGTVLGGSVYVLADAGTVSRPLKRFRGFAMVSGSVDIYLYVYSVQPTTITRVGAAVKVTKVVTAGQLIELTEADFGVITRGVGQVMGVKAPGILTYNSGAPLDGVGCYIVPDSASAQTKTLRITERLEVAFDFEYEDQLVTAADYAATKDNVSGLQGTAADYAVDKAKLYSSRPVTVGRPTIDMVTVLANKLTTNTWLNRTAMEDDGDLPSMKFRADDVGTVTLARYNAAGKRVGMTLPIPVAATGEITLTPAHYGNTFGKFKKGDKWAIQPSVTTMIPYKTGSASDGAGYASAAGAPAWSPTFTNTSSTYRFEVQWNVVYQTLDAASDKVLADRALLSSTAATVTSHDPAVQALFDQYLHPVGRPDGATLVAGVNAITSSVWICAQPVGYDGPVVEYDFYGRAPGTIQLFAFRDAGAYLYIAAKSNVVTITDVSNPRITLTAADFGLLEVTSDMILGVAGGGVVAYASGSPGFSDGGTYSVAAAAGNVGDPFLKPSMLTVYQLQHRFKIDTTKQFATATAVKDLQADVASLQEDITALMSGSSGILRPTRDPQWDDIRAIWEIVGILMYGQSLSVGTYSTPPLSVTQMAYLLMYVGGMRPYDTAGTVAQQYGSFIQAFESAPSTLGETPVMGCMLMIAQLLRDEDGLDLATMGQWLLGAALGQGGQSAASLAPGGAYFPRVENALTYGASNSTALGRTWAPGILGLQHAQTDTHDSTSPATYATIIESIRAGAESFAAGVLGYTRRLPLALTQTASHIQYGKPPAIALKQLEMCAQDLYGFVGSDHPYDRHTDGLHLNNIGSLQQGAKFGLFIKRWLWDGYKTPPLTPKVTKTGKSIIATFPVYPGMGLGLRAWPGVANYGATIVNAANVDIPITSVALVGSSSVRFTTGSIIASGNKLRLGFIGDATRGMTGIFENNPLRFDPTGFNLDVHSWAPICETVVP